MVEPVPLPLRRSASAGAAHAYIELDREFADLKSEDMNEASERALIAAGYGKSTRWDDLLKSERVVLFAEAGSGKTWDMRERAALLTQAGKPAFFVPIEALGSEGLRDYLGLEASDLARFDAWLAAPDKIAWLFLDAVDELKLTTGTLDRALGRVARDVGAGRNRLRVILSCRPTDWRPVEDKDTLLRRLPTSDPVTLDPDPVDPEDQFLAPLRPHKTEERPAQGAKGAAEKLRMVILLPLDTQRIRQFAVARGTADPDVFLAEITKQDAQPFARRPLDLDRLLRSWEKRGSLGTHLEQHEDDVAASLAERAGHPHATSLSAEEARIGAERLALALTLTRSRALREPGGYADSDDGALPPASVLTDWTDAQIEALLRRPLFDPATYGRVRFHHRGVQEYLAAARLVALRAQGLSARQLHRLLFADTYREKVIIPAMRPIVAWLALRNADVCREALARQPEVLILHGDPGSLPLQTRRDLLGAFMHFYGGGGWRGIDTPVAEARRLAHADLIPDIRHAWETGGANDEARAFLLKLIALGALDACADIALEAAFDSALEPYTRNWAIQALAACKRLDLMRLVADNMLSTPQNWPDRMVIYGSDDLFPAVLSVAEYISLVRRTPEPHSTTSGFGWSLLRLVDTLDPLSGHAVELRDTLTDMIWDARVVTDAYAAHSGFGYLIPALAALCLRQLEAGVYGQSLVRAAVVASRLGDHESLARDERGKMAQAFRSNAGLRVAIARAELATSRILAPTKEGFRRYYHAFAHGSLSGHFASDDWTWLIEAYGTSVDREDREAYLHALIDLWFARGKEAADRLELLELTADDAELRATAEGRTDLTPRKPNPEELKWQKSDRQWKRRNAARQTKREADWQAWRTVTLADPAAAFSGDAGDSALYTLMNWLRASDSGNMHLSHGNWPAVRRVLGSDVGQRFEDGLRAYWRRAAPPLRSRRKTDEENVIFGHQGTALTALLVEAASASNWPLHLTEAEAIHAARWSTLDLNGLPEWTSQLAAAWPAETVDVLMREIEAELGAQAAARHPHVLSGIEYGAEDLQRLLAPRLRTLLEGLPPSPDSDEPAAAYAENVGGILSVLVAAGDVDSGLAAFCRARFTETLAAPVGAVWLRGAFACEFDRGQEALSEGLATLHAEQRSSRGVEWFAALFGERRTRFGIRIEGNAETILRLTKLAYDCIRRDEDIQHDGVYSPDARDDAQDARNRLIGALIDKPGPDAHNALLSLAEEPLFRHMPDRLRLLARERAAADSEPPTWTVDTYREWAARFETMPRTAAGLFATMQDRLDDLAYETREHDFNNRRTLAKIERETELQPFIALWLEKEARGHYQVEREPESADKKKTDIRLLAQGFAGKAAIEIKIGDNDWSVRDLEATIRDQIIGQYLRHDSCKIGCLLITYAGRKGFEHPETGRPMAIEDVVRHLESVAAGCEAARGDIRLAVKLLDLRHPLKP